MSERRSLRADNPGGDPARLDLSLLHPEAHAFLAAPIVSPAHVSGWICLVGNKGPTFTEEDEHLLEALSAQVGNIYENLSFSLAAVKRDITERHQAGEALRTAEEPGGLRWRRPASESGTWTTPRCTPMVRIHRGPVRTAAGNL